MRKNFVVLCSTFLFLLASNTCFARLGENMDELIKRYGEPTEVTPGASLSIDQTKDRGGYILFEIPNQQWCHFSSNKINVFAVVDSNKICQYITFGPAKGGSSLETKEISDLLEKNSQGNKCSGENKFKSNYTNFPVSCWYRDDGGYALQAWGDSGPRIYSGECMKIIKAQEDAKKVKRNTSNF